jgi:hypothetical protein
LAFADAINSLSERMPLDGAITSTLGRLASGVMPEKSRSVSYGVFG